MKFETIVRMIEPYTILSRDRLRSISQLAMHAAHLPGDMAEVGVYRGGVPLLLKQCCPHKTMHAFDTFTGIPAADITKGDGLGVGMFGDASDAPERLRGAGVEVHVGVFPQTTAELPNEQRFCFAHYDGDTYRGTLDFLCYFYPRMTAGGVLLFDDWLACPWVKGIELALYEFCRTIPERPIDTVSNQCMLIKLPEVGA